jgi:O-antigen ligase
MYVSYSKNNRRFGVKEIVLMGIMFVFGAFSISVTFYITAFIFFGCIVIFNDRKRGLLYIAIAAVLVIIGLSIFKNQVNIFLSVYNARISEANIGERSVIWMEYWNAIKSNPLSLLIGRGALAKLQITAHSTLFRMLFMNGILGTILIINYIIEHTLKAKSAKQWLDFSMFPLVVPFVIYNLVLDAMRENGAYMILLYVMMIYFLYGERGKDFEGRYEVRVDE